MRTIIELSPEHLAALDKLRKRKQSSRAALIRDAVEAYLASQNPRTREDRPGFGAWKHKRVDAIKYQRRIREEWDR